ncbi:stress response translation initiation inhibitor YciH [Thermococcus sp. 18S1]|uniref:Protein translation factor SUI1 homolog n=5 Tax=Thermococcaceae TaxID=2259 RepID=A0A117ITV1_9EURY|nr:translation initiation factor Sui1 [Thermococcus sp. 4557]KUH34628.1 protein translation factor SUI1 [Thermococcus celericrescens]NJE00641.1 stress response translation initiation inhibitor YciH [Thermococcus sp. JdF3]NJE30549.1 stress response translation initiation inhibitor YciH [Thermococcus sp. 18S1]QDA30768.1 stress response translation initiation inhibitor YciH [Thermococcus indicus]QEK14798.1 stress response translation initiation inhibitor YciH [Thermococcus aciditolerans]CAD52435
MPRIVNPLDEMLFKEVLKEQQRIRVYIEKARYGKLKTIIEGIDEKEFDLDDIAKKLKAKLACGGTVKKGRIELQGDHRERVKKLLGDLGFSEDLIEIE